MSAKKTLEDVYKQYTSLNMLRNSAKESVERNANTKFARAINIPVKRGGNKSKQAAIDKYFDQLYADITELYILKLITTFEKILFDKIDNTHGIFERAVAQKCEKLEEPISFSKSSGSFIKNPEDIRSLSGTKNILKNQISQELFEDLKKIIDHRNWLLHGKRRTLGKDSNLNIEEIKEILMDIIDEIG